MAGSRHYVVFCGWMACWGARLFVCGITIIGYRYLVVGGVWLTQMVFGVRWCIVGCLGWHMVVVPGPAICGCCLLVVVCGVGVLCENWIVDASNLFFLYFVWFIHTPLRTWFCCVCGGVVLPFCCCLL